MCSSSGTTSEEQYGQVGRICRSPKRSTAWLQTPPHITAIPSMDVFFATFLNLSKSTAVRCKLFLLAQIASIRTICIYSIGILPRFHLSKSPIGPEIMHSFQIDLLAVPNIERSGWARPSAPIFQVPTPFRQERRNILHHWWDRRARRRDKPTLFYAEQGPPVQCIHKPRASHQSQVTCMP